MTDIRKLPAGIQTFSKLREEGCVYVDKTDLIYKLAHSFNVYFLARPRRFGKSLLVSTLDAYFSGRRDLFKGLAIESLETEWEQYPVIRIDFGQNGYTTNEDLLATLNHILTKYETKYDITKPDEKASVRFQNLLETINAKTGKKTVILIDEYDKPILDALYTPVAEQNRIAIRDFYGVMKAADEYIRFIFLTGIVRVPHLNIFSGLNQMTDITMNNDYAAICGITKDELLATFGPEIERMAADNEMSYEECVEGLKKMYDGYHFCKKSPDIFNPFSLLNAFISRDFSSKWAESGTPSILIKALKNNPVDITNYIDTFSAIEASFNLFDVESHSLLPLMYQTGYLTIKDYDKATNLYRLGLPNGEVANAFYQALIPMITPITSDNLGITYLNFRKAMEAENMERLESLIASTVASLPYLQNKKHNEDMYRNILYMLFTVIGYPTTSESVSSMGRADIVVEVCDKVYIFELKMANGGDPAKRTEDALAQIDERHYADRFSTAGRTVIKIALVFDDNGAGLAGFGRG